MDSLVEENETRYLEALPAGFGDILGSNGVEPKEAWSGHEYTLNGKTTLVQMVTFDCTCSALGASEITEAHRRWTTRLAVVRCALMETELPESSLLLMDPRRRLLGGKAGRRIQRCRNPRAVETGEYSDPRATEWITECLIKRRDKIAEAWFSKVLPLDQFRISTAARVRRSGCGARDRQNARIHSALGELGPNGHATALPDVGTGSPSRRHKKYSGGNIGCAGPMLACGNPANRVRPAVRKEAGGGRHRPLISHADLAPTRLCGDRIVGGFVQPAAPSLRRDGGRSWIVVANAGADRGRDRR